MEPLTTRADMHAWSRSRHREGKRIAFVPTMGALHEGHLSLVRLARTKADVVVASIFVNPTQFDRQEDLEAYPRTLETDLALLGKAGVDAVYLPEVAAMYPDGYASFIDIVGPLTNKLCGMARPGHFRGVATVVAKLFNAVEPDVAVFGQKDLQQCLIVARLIGDLDLSIELAVGPTVREVDGLAMSSRNRRLDARHRRVALALPRGLELANRAFKAGETSSIALTTKFAEYVLQEEGTQVDYVDVVRLAGFVEAEKADEGCVLAAAVFVGEVRLIDHVRLGQEPLPVAVDGD